MVKTGPPQEGKRMSGASSMSLEAHRPPRSTGLKPSRRASCSTVDLESEQSLQISTWRRIKGTLPLLIAQFCGRPTFLKLHITVCFQELMRL